MSKFGDMELIEVFKDTKMLYTTNSALAGSIANSIASTVFYAPGIIPEKGRPRFSTDMHVSVTRNRSLDAALRHCNKASHSRVAVLNFASATNPGGGVVKGSKAQEEALCRCSTLFPVLNTQELQEKFYRFHQERQDTRYTDACIYTPGITVFKTDTNIPERLMPELWRQVDIISCAAPNLRKVPYNKMNPGTGPAIPVSDKELLEIHKTRGRKIFRIAVANGIDTLILGAFGCGAFKNPPAIVARAYREILEEFDGYISKVEFAVYCPPGDDTNYRAFTKVMR